LSTGASVSLDAAGDPVVSVTVCWSGSAEQGEATYDPDNLFRFNPIIVAAQA
jgi:hypothetical protein